ncbi:MAG: ethanolamine ammonia-lyase subunit EutC [Terriglobales bacterium]
MTEPNKPKPEKMNDGSQQPLIHAPNDAIGSLRNYTSARVALGRSGSSIVTTDILDFQLAHAQARDAVKVEFDVEHFAQRVRREVPALEEFSIPVLTLNSAARDRETFVRRPDLGRVLAEESAPFLKPSPCDVAFVIADGLSAAAPERNAIPLFNAAVPILFEAGWIFGPVCVVKHARVAIGDQIGSRLGASLSVVLIGERPGLSSHESLGAYITWQPRPGRTDAERNCISNIRTGGLNPLAAAQRLFWYLNEARFRKLSGTALKEAGQETYLAI